MKRRFAHWICCFFFAWGFGASPIFSREVSEDRAWTLEECIEIALKNRPELDLANLDIFQTEQWIKEANSYYLPRVNMTMGYTHFNRPLEFKATIDLTEVKRDLPPEIGTFIPNAIEQSYAIGKTDWFAINLDLTQPVYTFGRIKEGVHQARIGQSIAVNQKEKKKEEIAFEVKKGYSQLLMAGEILQLLKEAEIRTHVVAQMVKIAYETAVPEEKEGKGTTRIDYLKARNFHSEIKAKLSEAGKNFKLAQLGLKMAMGLYRDAPVNVNEPGLEALPMALREMDEMKGSALDKNLDLKSLDLGVQFLDSRRKSASKEYFPKIGLFGNYLGPQDRYGNSNAWFAGIGLTLPLFEGFLTRAKVGQAEAQFQKAKGQKVLLEAALSVQMEHLHATLKELKERAGILRSSLKEAKERAQLAADGYASGITEFEELLLAQKAEIELKAGYLQSLFLFQMTKSEIEFISRTP